MIISIIIIIIGGVILSLVDDLPGDFFPLVEQAFTLIGSLIGLGMIVFGVWHTGLPKLIWVWLWVIFRILGLETGLWW